MRGQQLSEIVRRHAGEELTVRYVSEKHIDQLAGSIVILTRSFLRDAQPDELVRLRKANNIVCVDNVDHEAKPELHDGVDVYIASSLAQYVHYSRKHADKHVHLITHHTDPLIDGIRGQTSYCNIGYFGELVNARYVQELGGLVNFVQTNNAKAPGKDWIGSLKFCNVHYAVRSKRRVYPLRPFTKGFTAAQCHSNLIVSPRESDAVDYLTSDYPYLLQSESLASVTGMIHYAIESFGGPDWQRGLDIMASVRERCSQQQIVREVKDLVASC
jgi:hypothetical protein